MKRNAFTPVPTTPRISDAHCYASIHTNGLESMLNTECNWIIRDCEIMNQYGYTDTDYAHALYESKSIDLEYIRVDLSAYSYIMEGWC